MAPLSGIRVLDLGFSWAGPFAAMLLADLGAEVIKVESRARVDILRFSGSYAHGIRDFERSGYYLAANRGKKSVSLNLKTRRGRDLLHGLVAVSDVLIENFSPRVLGTLGLGQAERRALNPRLITMSMSGYGATGPDRDSVSYGDHLLHASGIASITGPEGDPHTKIGTFYGDPVGGLYGALGVLTALRNREQGKQNGVDLELAQVEALISMLAAALMRQSSGRPRPRTADKSPEMAPHGFYRCAGDDRWVSLAVRDDRRWRSFREHLAADRITLPVAPSLTDRLAVQNEIDRLITEWTSQRSPWDITAALQARRIAAFPVMNSPDLLWSNHLHDREFFRWLDRPISGPAVWPGLLFRVDGDAADIRGPAPLMGQHNREVLTGLLGLAEHEIQSLEEEQVVY